MIGAVGGSGTAVSYNPASQIISIPKSNDAYAWTGSLNVDRLYTTNGLNQYTLAGTTSFSYTDARGNLTNSGASAYTYSKLNELKTAPGGTLSYDPQSRLVQYDATGSTRMYYSGADLIAEVANPTGTVLRRYVPGPGTDEPIVWYEGSGTTDRRFLQADERGSVVAISDSGGAMLAINRYDEFGIPQTGNTGRFAYTGQTWFPEIGLYNYKARWYSPSMGRFMQTDPIGYGDGLNWYNYAHSDPVNSVDPTGTSCYLGTGMDGYQPIVCTHMYTPRERQTDGDGGGARDGGAGLAIALARRMPPQSGNGNQGCGTHSDLADAALYVLNFAGTTADVASLGLAAASAATGGPLDPVGATLGFGAIVANRFSAATSGAAIPINLYQGNYRGAAANVAGLVAGHFAADLAGKALGAPMSGIKKDATNTAASQAASNGSGC